MLSGPFGAGRAATRQRRGLLLSAIMLIMTMTRFLYSSSSSSLNKVSALCFQSTRTTSSSKILVNSRRPASPVTSNTKSNPRNSHHYSTSSSTSFLRQSTQRRQEDLAAEFSSLSSSGYDRPTVQWYPGHIAKAERQLSETLKAVDVVVEVRDARACKATAHPRVGEWCAGRPRIVVLTHLDTVPKAAAASWRRAYESLGAERWDDAPINRQVANQAQQARDIRSQFLVDDPNNKNDDNHSTKKKRKNTSKSVVSTDNNQATNAITPVEQVLFVNAKEGQGIHALHRAIFKAGSHVQERRERRGLNPRALRVGIIGYPNVGKVWRL
jgi:hypothetical protein